MSVRLYVCVVGEDWGVRMERMMAKHSPSKREKSNPFLPTCVLRKHRWSLK